MRRILIGHAMRSVEHALASILREGASSADGLANLDCGAVLAAAEAHGITGLLRRGLATRGGGPVALKAALDTWARHQAVMSTWRQEELVRVMDALHRAGVATIVFKGAALACTHYAAPYLRPHCDTDLLVQKHGFDSAGAVLEELGYRRVTMVSREMVHTQCEFERPDGALIHFVDLHWAISSRPLFARMLTFDLLARDAIPVKALGEHALTPSPVCSLLIACIHRVSHHDDSERLIWLYDIKLLAESLSAEEWERLGWLATERAIVKVCRRSLELAAHRVGCSDAVREATARLGAIPGRREPSAAFLGGGTTGMRALALDFRTVRGWHAKIRLVASHAFPDMAYMRGVFGATGRVSLLGAYVRRALAGAWRIVVPRL